MFSSFSSPPFRLHGLSAHLGQGKLLTQIPVDFTGFDLSREIEEIFVTLPIGFLTANNMPRKHPVNSYLNLTGFHKNAAGADIVLPSGHFLYSLLIRSRCSCVGGCGMLVAPYEK
jgi:hypothetical protein